MTSLWEIVPPNLLLAIVVFWTAGTCLFSFVLFELCCGSDHEELQRRGQAYRKTHVV